MNHSSSDFAGDSRIAQEASAWVLRCDRGLTPTEQDEFSTWLAADPRHGARLAQHRQHWQRLNTLAQWRPEHSDKPNPDLLAPQTRSPVLRFASYAALAAAAAAVLLVWPNPRVTPTTQDSAPIAVASASPSTSRTLPDGTFVELNRDADLVVEFSAIERRVRLVRGEAHFAVTKDSARPFVVHAGGVDVRAVGTAFNVRLGAATLEVLVTEGQVGVERIAPGSHEKSEGASLQLAPRQRAVVSLAAAAPPQIATLTAGEIERVLAWQHRVVDFTAAPLREVVAQFNRRNVVQLVVADPELAAEKISATFRTDNVEGFVRLLEAGFGAVADRNQPDAIVLRRASR